MNLGDLSLICAWTLLDGLVDGGVREACISPGSRSTPLALAAARHPDITVRIHLDERSSAFFALGLARASRRPVAIICTSGTAAAEFLPGVIEASQSRVPLVVITADRPPRVRGTGANQTIDQIGLYGDYVRGSFDLAVPEAEGQETWWRQTAREALAATRSEPVGPVHLNCPFEEPLSPSIDVDLPEPSREQLDLPTREGADLTEEEGDRLAAMTSGARGVIVAGSWPGDVSGEAALWIEALGWPLVAEPMSSMHRPGEALAAGQAVVGDPGWSESHAPEVIIQFGAAPTSRATQAFVGSAEQLVVADRWHLDADPERRATWRIAVDPGALRQALEASGQDRRLQPAPGDWTEAWHDADARARATMDSFLDGISEPFEPCIARDVARAIPDGGTLFVGNSTPIRDLDLAMEPRADLRVMANRGASGIDGLVSTALGIATSSARSGPAEITSWPTVALLGDLSFLYDAGALLWAGRSRVDLTLVVVRNGGGEIFSLLAQRELPEHRDLFTTPHDVDIATLCTAARVRYVQVDRADAVNPTVAEATAAGGLQVIEVVVDAAQGLELRRQLRAALADALGR